MRIILTIIIVVCFARPSWAFEALNEGNYICFYNGSFKIDVFGFELKKVPEPVRLSVSGNNIMVDDIVPFVLKTVEEKDVGFQPDYFYHNDDFNTDLQFAAVEENGKIGALFLQTERERFTLNRVFSKGECIKK